MRHLIDILDLEKEEINDLIKLALDIKNNPKKYEETCKHKVLATLFFEPSTRTRLSFESAMLHLGGNVISVPDSNSSSAIKGESIADTAKIVSNYADIMVIRHNKEGAPLVASMNSKIPLINAGDGGHFHPTQTLADLSTIYQAKKTFENLKVGFCGDLKYGRTVHSLISALSRYKNVSFTLISPEELKLPSFIKDEFIKAKNINYTQSTSLEESIDSLDVLYMTRIQKERLGEENYDELKNLYILDEEKMKNAKKDMIILHPLPRVNEISTKIDKDPRALYFEQASNGRYMRMALIINMLQNKIEKSNILNKTDILINQIYCTNTRCICSTEQELDNIFFLSNKEKNEYRCIYCEDKKIKNL